MSDDKQIGTVEILVDRTYPLDPEASDLGFRTEVIVKPGVYPLYRDKLATFWMMEGVLNDGWYRRHGDGMFTHSARDIPSEFSVRFPSRRMGEDEFAELRRHTVCKEGHPDQRIRITLFSNK